MMAKKTKTSSKIRKIGRPGAAGDGGSGRYQRRVANAEFLRHQRGDGLDPGDEPRPILAGRELRPHGVANASRRWRR